MSGTVIKTMTATLLRGLWAAPGLVQDCIAVKWREGDGWLAQDTQLVLGGAWTQTQVSVPFKNH